MQRVRVLYLITDLDMGGAEKSLCGLIAGLDRSRFEAEAACLCGRGYLAGELVSKGFRVHFLEAEKCPVAACVKLVRLLLSLRPHILHTYLFHANAAGVLAGALAGIRSIICSARVADREHPWRARVEAFASRRARAYTCVSEAVKWFMAESGVPSEKLLVINNGVDTEKLRPVAREGGGECLLSVGRLHPQKGMDVLLDAAAIVRRSRPGLRVVIAGIGPLEERLRRQAERLGLGDAASFEGLVPDIARLAAGAGLFVLLSRWEGMPNAVLEAMAMGLPVVATRVEGVSEAVVDGECGFLVSPDNAPEAAGAIEKLLADESLRDRMGGAARERAENLYSVRRMVRENERLYLSARRSN